MIRTITSIVQSRNVDARQLGWLSGRRAETRNNFPANFQYVDLRGLTRDDLRRELEIEGAAYHYLEANGYSQGAIDMIDRQQTISSVVPMVDFGMGSAVVGLSALGCIPVTSCRGPTLGRQAHSQPAPMVVFYARPSHISLLLQAVAIADCQIVNNDAKVEIYSDDVRKLRQFSLAMLDLLSQGQIG